MAVVPEQERPLRIRRLRADWVGGKAQGIAPAPSVQASPAGQVTKTSTSATATHPGAQPLQADSTGGATSGGSSVQALLSDVSQMYDSMEGDIGMMFNKLVEQDKND